MKDKLLALWNLLKPQAMSLMSKASPVQVAAGAAAGYLLRGPIGLALTVAIDMSKLAMTVVGGLLHIL